MNILNFLCKAGFIILFIYNLIIIIGCESNKWNEIQVPKNENSNKKSLVISSDFMLNMPFTYICFLESDIGNNIDEFKNSTKVIFRKNTNEEILITNWLGLQRNGINYICTMYNQNYGAKTHFNSLEIISDYVFMINKVFWINSAQ